MTHADSLSSSSLITRPSFRISLRRIIAHLTIALTGAHGLSVTGFLLLRLLVGERWSFVGLFNSFAHLLILPALVLLPLMLVLKRWRVALLQLAPALTFLSLYAGMFLPNSAQAAADSPAITVLSYNLLKDNFSFDAIVAVIREANADVVALQELNTVQAKVIAERLSDLYPHMALHPQLEGYSGQGVLSRYPVLADDFWIIHMGHQHVELDVHGRQIAFYNVHPSHPLGGFFRFRGAGRANEVTEVLTRAGQETLPVIIAGDFNMTNLADDYARITASYADSYRAVGWGMGFTFPDLSSRRFLRFIPLARIDYVFHDSSFRPLEARVWDESAGSDHRPLFVRLALGL